MTASPSQYFETFLTSEVALSQRFERVARKSAFTGSNAREATAWQESARRRFASLLGLDKFERAPAKPQKTGSVKLDGLTREEWRIQTEPDVWMPFYLFIPDGVSGKAPLVLCPHGHGSAGKWATGGRTDIPAMVPIVKGFNYDYGVQIARLGFITACPDARGFGERREPWQQNDRAEPHKFSNSSCHELMLSGAPLGLTVQGMWTWDLMRLIDHLSNDPRIDASRVGSAGLSGGGMQTLDLAAVDTRVKAAVVSGYFYGVYESLLIQNMNCMCNLVPNLWQDFDMGDIGALIAPRGLLIETGDADPLNGRSGLANVKSQVEITRKTYNALDASNKLEHHIFSGGHKWDGTRALPWLKEML
ncbi:MAG TPA: alpha/beta hydrolase family protein [Planctomycetota bacterium]|nr:alpha/beta hydrolase family protein [Planctomycetota bacterium]